MIRNRLGNATLSMKRKIAAAFLLCAIEQCISNFDLNISAQIRTRSSEERDETEREGTGPNLLPDVGVFARAGPSGVPSRPTPQGKKPSSSSSSGEWSDPEGERRAKQCQAEVEAWERKHGHPMWIECGEGCPDESQSDEEGRKPAQELQEKNEEDDEQQPEDFENGASDSDQTPPLVIDEEDQVQGNDERNQEAD